MADDTTPVTPDTGATPIPKEPTEAEKRLQETIEHTSLDEASFSLPEISVPDATTEDIAVGETPKQLNKNGTNTLAGIEDITSYIQQKKQEQQKKPGAEALVSLDGTDLTKLPSLYAIIPHSKGDHKLVFFRNDTPAKSIDDEKGRTKGTTYTKNNMPIYTVHVDMKQHPTLKGIDNEPLDVRVIDKPGDLDDQIAAIQNGKGGGGNFGYPILLHPERATMAKKEDAHKKNNKESNEKETPPKAHAHRNHETTASSKKEAPHTTVTKPEDEKEKDHKKDKEKGKEDEQKKDHEKEDVHKKSKESEKESTHESKHTSKAASHKKESARDAEHESKKEASHTKATKPAHEKEKDKSHDEPHHARKEHVVAKPAPEKKEEKVDTPTQEEPKTTDVLITSPAGDKNDATNEIIGPDQFISLQETQNTAVPTEPTPPEQTTDSAAEETKNPTENGSIDTAITDTNKETMESSVSNLPDTQVAETEPTPEVENTEPTEEIPTNEPAPTTADEFSEELSPFQNPPLTENTTTPEPMFSLSEEDITALSQPQVSEAAIPESVPPTAPTEERVLFHAVDESSVDESTPATDVSTESEPLATTSIFHDPYASPKTTPPSVEEQTEPISQNVEAISPTAEQPVPTPEPDAPKENVLDLDSMDLSTPQSTPTANQTIAATPTPEIPTSASSPTATKKVPALSVKSFGIIIRVVGGVAFIGMSLLIWNIMFPGSPDPTPNQPIEVDSGSVVTGTVEDTDTIVPIPTEPTDEVPTEEDPAPTEPDPIEQPEDTMPEQQFTIPELIKKLEAQELDARRLLNKAKLLENRDAIKFSTAALLKAAKSLENAEKNSSVTADELQEDATRIDLYLQQASTMLE